MAFSSRQHEKTVQLKTKLKADECASYLSQFTSEESKDTKPLTGWVNNQTFELSPSHAGLFNIEGSGVISEDAEGATILFKTNMSKSAKRFLTLFACLILGSAAALFSSYLKDIDVFGETWGLLILFVIPSIIWLCAFAYIKRELESKRDSLINTLSSTLKAQTVSAALLAPPNVRTERPAKQRRNNGLQVLSLAVHIIPFIAGMGLANYFADYLHDRAWSAWTAGRYAESENYCRPIMQLTELFYSADKAKLSYANYILAENCRCQGKNEEALKHYQLARALQEQVMDNKDPNLAWTYDNIGKTLDALQKPEAVEYYNKAINIWKQQEHPPEALIARTLDRVALFHSKYSFSRSLKEALIEENDVIERDEQKYGKSSMSYAEDLNDLALIQMLSADYASAEKTIAQAVLIKEKWEDESVENKLHLMKSYQNQIRILDALGKKVAAAQCSEKLDKLMNSLPEQVKNNKSEMDRIMRIGLEFPNVDRRQDISIDDISSEPETEHAAEPAANSS